LYLYLKLLIQGGILHYYEKGINMEEILYTTLGVKPDATDEQIKKAYRNKSKTLHPDIGGDEETFKNITEAYRILSDPKLRKAYDSTGKIPKSVEAMEADADVMLRQLFGMAIENWLKNSVFSPPKEEVLTMMKSTIIDKQKKIKAAIKNKNTLLKAVKDLRSVIKYTKEDDGIDLYNQCIELKTTALNYELNDAEVAMQIVNIADVNLKDYIYNKEYKKEGQNEITEWTAKILSQ